MKHLKSLGFVLLVFAVILVLVIARSANKNLFKKEANVTVELLNNDGSTLSKEQLTSEHLVVDLSAEEYFSSTDSENVINIPFQELLEKQNRKFLEDSKQKIVLYSKDISMASKAWVILNQLDFKDLYILDTIPDSEVFKYKFQPDSLAKLE